MEHKNDVISQDVNCGEVQIIDEKGYDIGAFLCRCPNKTTDGVPDGED